MGNKLMARIGHDDYDRCLAEPYTAETDFTGKPIRSMVYVLPEGFESDKNLTAWVQTCTAFVDALRLKTKETSV
ncbi:MAG: hypothetical protein QNK43_05800 [Amphritea sp.]|nr:hypothetical protein [Amphritea sp.]